MTNKTALLTGGSRGIGKATADLLRASEWDVIAPTRAELDFSQYESVLNYALDVADVSRKVDAIVFAHGEWFLNENQSEMDWINHFNMRVNFPAMFLRETVLDTHGASIVFVSSTQAFDGPVTTLPYAVACVAQIRLMQGCVKSKVSNARYNVVAPGLTDTDLGQQVISTGGAKPGALMQPPGVVAAEIVRLIESGDSGRVMRVVNSEVTEAKWSW